MIVKLDTSLMHKVDMMSQNTDFFNLGAYCFPTNSSIWVQGFNLEMLWLIPSTLHNIQVMSVSNSVHLLGQKSLLFKHIF